MLSCAIFCEWDGSPSRSPSTLKRCSFSKLSNSSLLVKFGNEMVVIGNRLSFIKFVSRYNENFIVVVLSLVKLFYL